MNNDFYWGQISTSYFSLENDIDMRGEEHVDSKRNFGADVQLSAFLGVGIYFVKSAVCVNVFRIKRRYCG